MAANPPNLTLIGSDQPGSRPDPSTPPAGLKEAGRDLWARVHKDFVVEGANGLETLFQVCSAADRAHECGEVISREGAAVRIKGGGVKEHPLLRCELQTRAFIVRTLARMGFDIVMPRAEVGRPASAYRGEER
jgi:hypothetical protein